MNIPRMVDVDVNALDAGQASLLFDRGRSGRADVRHVVADVIEDVRVRGDTALRDLALRFDGVQLDALEVPSETIAAALDATDPDVRASLEQSAAAIRVFHAAQLPQDLEIEVTPGVRLGRRAEPLARVGVYAPGGRAAYPSSVLMGVVPARVAGVGEVVVCSPPGADGLPPAVVLAACAIAGVDRVYAVGGAGAIAALAFGTDTIARVAKIVGPGNAYVTEAKQQLTGVVAIDSPAGPSEVLVIADATADPDLIAIELLAQAEHDADAAAVAVLVDAAVAPVRAALDRLLRDQPRRSIIEQSLAARGAILTATTLADALDFAERYAPEHLSLMVAAPRDALARVRCAGTVFLGSASSVAFGDYTTGANHVLPTDALARSYSGLATTDFLRYATYQEVSAQAASALAGPTQILAVAEGLPAHAQAAAMRAVSSAGAVQRTALPIGRAAYADIELYEPGRVPCDVDLSDNTNLDGVPPAARAVLNAPADGLVTRYPTVQARALRSAIADTLGVAPENVVTGCGSDDILDSIVRAFCDPGAVVAYPTPTFGVVELFARMNAARPVAVPHTPSLQLDVPALVATGAAVTYVCRPNNPTGTLYTREDVERLANAVSGVLVIDEAYIDYAGDDMTAFAIAQGRTLIVRTMSKAYGLAGLRIGCAIGAPSLIREVEKSRGPYKVGGVAEAAAIAALGDTAWVRAHVQRVVENRERLAGGLCARGSAPLASAANFLLVPLPPNQRATDVALRLRERGVAVRPFTSLPGLASDALRVTVGPWPLMERFLAALTGTGVDR